jgi:PAS domain S-box-containing protein
MSEEPEIVKILREEERLRAAQSHSHSPNEANAVLQSPDTDTAFSDESCLLLESFQGQKNTIQPEYLQSISQVLFESRFFAILVLDTQKRIISWNKYTEHLLRKTNIDLYLQSVGSLHSTDEWVRIEKTLDHSSDIQHHIETKILVKNTEALTVAVSLIPLQNDARIHLGYLYLIKNITEQKQAESYLTSLLKFTDDVIFLLDSTGHYLMGNQALLSKLGRPVGEVLGKTYTNFHSSSDTKEFTQKLSWVFEHGLAIKDIYCDQGNWYFRTLHPIMVPTTKHVTAVLVLVKDITENKKTEEMLLEKEQKYHTMFDVFPHSIVLIDKNGSILEVNERITDWTQEPVHKIVGTNFLTLSFLSQESKRKIKKIFSKTKMPKNITPFEIETHAPKKKKHTGLVYISPLKNDQGASFAYLVVISDITEQKHIEELLRIKDSAIASSLSAITFLNLNGKMTYVNDSFLQMWGYTSQKEIIGKSIVHFWKSKDQFIEVMEGLKNKQEWIGELTGLRKDNTTFQVQLWANLIKDDYGKPICILGSFLDITRYKKAVKALSESEKRFQVVLENSLDMIYQYTLNAGTCDYVSPSSTKIVGYTPEELMSFPLNKVEEFIHPEDRMSWTQHMKTIMIPPQKQNTVQSIEYRFKHKTRGYRWMRDTCTAIYDEKNNVVTIIGSLEDITERKKVWEELVKSEEKYRILAETSADGVFTTDSLGRLTYVNPCFEKLCGRRKSQILATPFRNYLLEDSVYFFQQIFIDVRKKNDKIENVELELVAGDGEIIPIEANIAPLTKQTEFGGVVCTVRDITQRREIEDELKKNERLKTEFMNIAAHELRSPVTPIKGYLDLIIHDNESNDKIKNWAKISLRNAERLLKLVNDILDVARLDSDTMRFDMEKIDPIEFLNEIVEDMRPAIVNKKLEFRVNIPTSLPHILGDKNRLSQVLKNLIGNSLKFTDCGSIGLEVEKKENHILITVSDTGIGISQDEIKKIFTKFYQAYTGEDRNNEGTGLGLFISKEIIKKHNGTVWAESDVGKGSKFIIQLPYIYKMIVDFKT